MARTDYGVPTTLPYDPSTGGDDATPVLPLGTKVRYKGKTYIYVKFDNGAGNVAAVADNVAYWYDVDFDPPTVTMDYTDIVSDTDNHPAGIFLNVPTDGQYCFIQIGGYHAGINTTGASASAGDALIAGTTDGVATNVAADTAPTNRVIGWATAAEASNKTACFLVLDD